MGDAVYTQDTGEKAPIGEAQTKTYLEQTITDDDIDQSYEAEISPQYYYYPLAQDGAPFPGRIRFKVRKIEGKDIGSFLGESLENLKQFGADIVDFFTSDNTGPETANKLLELVTGKKFTPDEQQRFTDNKNQIDYVKLKEETFKKLRESASNAKEFLEGKPENQPQVITDILNSGRLLGQVVLPIPSDLRIVDQLGYSGEANLGLIGGFAEQGVATKTGAITGALQSVTAMGKALYANEVSREISSLVLAGLKNAPLIPDSIAQGASSASRIATNPNVRNLFERVALRNFTFTFKMVPTSRKENEMINNLIKFLRINAYPETITSGSIPVGYIYPNVFDIELLYDGKHVATKILPSYLRTITVAYNPTGAGMHSDGGFNEYEISLDFQEVLTLDKDKIDQGY